MKYQLNVNQSSEKLEFYIITASTKCHQCHLSHISNTTWNGNCNSMSIFIGLYLAAFINELSVVHAPWMVCKHDVTAISEIILCMCPTNERWRYNVTPSLIGWAHTQNDPYNVSYLTLLPLVEKRIPQVSSIVVDSLLVHNGHHLTMCKMTHMLHLLNGTAIISMAAFNFNVFHNHNISV